MAVKLQVIEGGAVRSRRPRARACLHLLQGGRKAPESVASHIRKGGQVYARLRRGGGGQVRLSVWPRGPLLAILNAAELSALANRYGAVKTIGAFTAPIICTEGAWRAMHRADRERERRR